MAEWKRQRWSHAVEVEAEYLEARAASRRRRHGWGQIRRIHHGWGPNHHSRGWIRRGWRGEAVWSGHGEALDPVMEALDPCAADPPTPLATWCVAASSNPPSCAGTWGERGREREEGGRGGGGRRCAAALLVRER